MKYNDYELISMVQENDEFSYGTLFQKYLPIIKKIASNYYHNYKNYGCDYDDFLQEGYIAFQNAVKNYDEARDTLFFTFVTLCINRALQSFCRKFYTDKSNCNYDNFVNCDDISLIDDCVDVEKTILYVEVWDELWRKIYQFPFDYICIVIFHVGNIAVHIVAVFLPHR